MPNNKYITIQVHGDEKVVLRTDYIKVKTKALREFGYDSLTSDEVSTQLDKILAGAPDLSVIGMFMKDDIVIEKAQ